VGVDTLRAALSVGVKLHPRGEHALSVGVDTLRAALSVGVICLVILLICAFFVYHVLHSSINEYS